MSRTTNDYAIIAGTLCKVDSQGHVLAEWRPIGTRIVQLLTLDADVVVREDHFGFPRNQSNLYRLGAALELKWSAQLPGPTDSYAHPVFVERGWLVCESWDGHRCWIDPVRGLIVGKEVTR